MGGIGFEVSVIFLLAIFWLVDSSHTGTDTWIVVHVVDVREAFLHRIRIENWTIDESDRFDMGKIDF